MSVYTANTTTMTSDLLYLIHRMQRVATMPNLDVVQAWALVLEIVGISLAALHVFQPKLTQVLSARIELVPGWFQKAGIGFSIENADDDMSQPIEERDQTARETAHTMLFLIPSIVVAMYIVEYGDGALWWIAEFLTSTILAVFIVMVFQAINMLITPVIVRILALAGKGNTIAGIGFMLAIAGLAMETFQVWHGPFRWVAYVSWSGVILVVTLIGLRLPKRR